MPGGEQTQPVIVRPSQPSAPSEQTQPYVPPPAPVVAPPPEEPQLTPEEAWAWANDYYNNLLSQTGEFVSTNPASEFISALMGQRNQVQDTFDTQGGIQSYGDGSTAGGPEDISSVIETVLAMMYPIAEGEYSITGRHGDTGGPYPDSGHVGLDLGTGGKSVTVRAPQEGRVIAVGINGGFGLEVRVQHPDGTITNYAHLSSSAVSVGDTVSAGQYIAMSGGGTGDKARDGHSTGYHLHFGVMQNGVWVDPEPWLNGGEATDTLEPTSPRPYSPVDNPTSTERVVYPPGQNPFAPMQEMTPGMRPAGPMGFYNPTSMFLQSLMGDGSMDFLRYFNGGGRSALDPASAFLQSLMGGDGGMGQQGDPASAFLASLMGEQRQPQPMPAPMPVAPPSYTPMPSGVRPDLR